MNPKQQPRQIALAFQIAIPHLERVTRGILDYARAHTSWQFAFSPEGSNVPLRSLRGWEGDGVIAMLDSEADLQMALGMPTPVVNISGSLRTPELTSVLSDNHAIGRLAAEHLLRHGFRRFGYFGLRNVGYAEDRCAGFLQTLSDAGHDCSICLASTTLHSKLPWQWDREQVTDWLTGLQTPVGVLAAHDYRARMLLESCHRLGLGVPEDVAVIGVNDDPVVCRHCQPPLSSVPQDGIQIGYQAAWHLDRLIQERSRNPGIVKVEPLPVAARASTDTVAVDDANLRKATEIIQSNLAELPGIEAIARQLGVSRRWLERLFQQQLNCTPHEFVSRSRVERAKEIMMSDPNAKFVDIARRCGFRDARRLSLVFRRLTGQSPREFRNQTARPLAQSEKSPYSTPSG